MKVKIFTLLILGILTLSCAKDNNEPLKVQSYVFSDTEIDLFNKINHFRDSIGVGELTLVQHVSYKCMEHNEYMINNNIVNHDYFYDRSTNIQNVCGATNVGEVIAYNYLTSSSVLLAWLNSPTHDTIIRSEFKRIGISIRESPNHRKYYTVIFID